MVNRKNTRREGSGPQASSRLRGGARHRDGARPTDRACPADRDKPNSGSRSGGSSSIGGGSSATTTGDFYTVHYTDDELGRIIAQLADPSARLDSAIEATYVLLDRILARVGPGEEDPDAFLKLVRAHNDTTGRIATLLRSRAVLQGDVSDSLTGHIAAALDQLAEQLHVEL